MHARRERLLDRPAQETDEPCGTRYVRRSVPVHVSATRDVLASLAGDNLEPQQVENHPQGNPRFPVDHVIARPVTAGKREGDEGAKSSPQVSIRNRTRTSSARTRIRSR